MSLGVGIVKLCWNKKAIIVDLGSPGRYMFGDNNWDEFNGKVSNAFSLGSPTVKYHFFNIGTVLLKQSLERMY